MDQDNVSCKRAEVEALGRQRGPVSDLDKCVRGAEGVVVVGEGG